MTFGKKLCGLRKKCGMSQEDLADIIKVSRQAVSRWETTGILPDAENIIKLSQLFGVSADFLLHDQYSSDADIPAVKNTSDAMKKEQNRQIAFTVFEVVYRKYQNRPEAAAWRRTCWSAPL